MATPPKWCLDPGASAAGTPGPITIRNGEPAPTRSMIRAIPGRLAEHACAVGIVRWLGEDDIAKARLIAAATRLRRSLAALVRWAHITGDWNASCWREAEALLAETAGAQALPDKP